MDGAALVEHFDRTRFSLSVVSPGQGLPLRGDYARRVFGLVAIGC